MDIKTGIIYDDYENAIKSLIDSGVSQKEANARLVPLTDIEYQEYMSMNRKERRKAAKIKRSRRRTT